MKHHYIYHKILYNDHKSKRKIGLRIFTQNMNWIHREWMKTNTALMQKHMGSKAVSYGDFIKLKPTHIVKKNYIALMACDNICIYTLYVFNIVFILLYMNDLIKTDS